MTSLLKLATKIRSEFDSNLFFLRSRQNVGHPTTYGDANSFWRNSKLEILVSN